MVCGSVGGYAEEPACSIFGTEQMASQMTNYSFVGIIDCTVNNVTSAVLCACVVNVAGVAPYAWQ